MSSYQTTRPIKSLANGGVNLAARQPVTPQAFTPDLWARLVAEGVVVEVGRPEPEPTPEPATEPTPEPATEPATAVDLADLDIDALKALADEKGISYTWNIKAETLRERIEAYG